MTADFLREFLASPDWQKMQFLFKEIADTQILWVVSNSGDMMQKSEEEYPELCKLIRRSPDGLKRCNRSQSARYREVLDTGRVVVSSCFCGLVGFALPFRLDSEVIAVAGGCSNRSASDMNSEKCTELSGTLDIDIMLLKKYAKGVKRMQLWEKQKFLSILSMFTGMSSLLVKWMDRLLLELSLENNYAAKISSLGEISALAASELNWEDMLSTITSKTRKLLEADACSIYTFDQVHRELALSATDGLNDNDVRNGMKMGEGITGYVAQNRSAVIIDDIEDDPKWGSVHGNERLPLYHSVLSVPLMAQDRLIGVIEAGNFQPKEWSQTDFDVILTIAVHIAGIIEKSKIHRELSKELEVARYIQEKLLPESLPEIEGYDIAAITIPHKEVGGDYYDCIELDNYRRAIVVADVCGKGVGAAILMANTRGLIHANAKTSVDVRDIIFKINNSLYGSTETDKFVTMFYGVLDSKTGKFIYTNGGHNPPFLYKANSDPEPLGIGGIVLGMINGMEYSQGEIQLSKGDIIVFYSDGVTEAQNSHGEQFGEERLHQAIHQHKNENSDLSSAQYILNRIYESVCEFSVDATASDDLTIMVIVSL